MLISPAPFSSTSSKPASTRAVSARSAVRCSTAAAAGTAAARAATRRRSGGGGGAAARRRHLRRQRAAARGGGATTGGAFVLDDRPLFRGDDLLGDDELVDGRVLDHFGRDARGSASVTLVGSPSTIESSAFKSAFVRSTDGTRFDLADRLAPAAATQLRARAVRRLHVRNRRRRGAAERGGPRARPESAPRRQRRAPRNSSSCATSSLGGGDRAGRIDRVAHVL